MSFFQAGLNQNQEPLNKLRSETPTRQTAGHVEGKVEKNNKKNPIEQK